MTWPPAGHSSPVGPGSSQCQGKIVECALMPTQRLNPFPSTWKCFLILFSGIWDPSEELLVQAFEFLDADYASVTAFWKCHKHIKCQVHKCDNDLNNGGLSEHRIYREQDGIPSLQEAFREFSLTERLVMGRTG